MTRTRWISTLTIVLLALALVAAAPGGAQAQKAGTVTSVLEALKVDKGTDGKEAFAEAKRAKAGDVLEYRLTYENGTPGDVRDLLATLPIPQGTTYVADTARPAGVMASVDGRAYEAVPLMREEKQPDGTVKKVPVPLASYRYLRWKVPALAKGGQVTLFARVRLLGPGSP